LQYGLGPSGSLRVSSGNVAETARRLSEV
jgi:hypothetical protein